MTETDRQSDPIIIPAKNKTNRLLFITNVVLLALCLFLLWENYDNRGQINRQDSTISELSDDRSALELELEEMLGEYQTLETDNEDLRAEMELEKAKVEELLVKVKNGSWEVHRLKKEASSLREIMKGYIVTIDSLNTLNQNLIVENTTVRSNLKSVEGRNADLEKMNSGLSNQVVLAQRLKAMNISSYGIRVKKDNTGKETDKAKKSNKIRTCFTLSENQLAIAGKKELFVRILTPDGRVLSNGTDESQRFSFNNVRGLFSIKQGVNYQNKEQNVCMDWVVQSELPIGEYVVDIYCEEADIGKTKFTLR